MVPIDLFHDVIYPVERIVLVNDYIFVECHIVNHVIEKKHTSKYFTEKLLFFVLNTSFFD